MATLQSWILPSFTTISLVGPSLVYFIRSAQTERKLHSRTLVGSGLKKKFDLRRRLEDLIPPHIFLLNDSVATFTPSSSTVTTGSGQTIGYDILVVAAGLQVKFDAIPGLTPALANPTSGVSSIYSYETCDKTWSDIQSLRNGKALFTQPSGVIKCAGGEHHSDLLFATGAMLTQIDSATENYVHGLGSLSPYQQRSHR